MVVRDNPLQSELVQHAKTFDEAILSSVDEEGHLISNPRAAIRSTDDAYIRQKKRVRSVQRFILPKGKSAKWVLEEYFRWLPQFLNPFLRCEANQNHGEIDFFLTGLPWALLKLKRTVETDNSCCLTITGGCLANTTDSKEGRLEFRAVFDNRYVIASIHDFCPRLPWYIYNASQAIAHLWVMKAFGRHLEKVNAAVS
jgi:hypothetical protein